MPGQPTPRQRALLELLSEFEALRTEQIHQYLAAYTSVRALRGLLARCREHGWVEGAPLHPGRGNAAEYYWLLSPDGAILLDLPADWRRPSLARLQQALAPGQPAIPLAAASTAVLELLVAWKQLTTSQIWQHLHPDRPRWYTYRILSNLAERDLIRGQALNPEEGTTAEYYWTLLERGARQLNLTCRNHFRRRPTVALIGYRGLQLNLIRQVETAGWALIRPARPPRPDVTPQVHQLTEAVLTVEELAIAAELTAGRERWRLQDRIERLRAGQVGASVPPAVNDYIAYLPARPEFTTVLIPQPPNAAVSFWTRKPQPEAARPEQRERRDSRLASYERLAKILPVIAVFDTRKTAAQYAPLVEPGGFRCVPVGEVAFCLREIAG